MDYYDPKRDRIPPLKGSENYFQWSDLMEIRLGRKKAWKAIISEPPTDYNIDEAPIVIEDFQEQYNQLGLPQEDTTRWNKRRWEVAYARFKEDIRKSNEWKEMDIIARSEIKERLTSHVQKEVSMHKSAQALWNGLKKLYATPLIAEQVRAYQTFMKIRRKDYPSARHYTNAMNAAYSHLTHNLQFKWDQSTTLTMHYLFLEADDATSDWSKFLDKHRTGTVLDDPEEICTTLHGLDDQSSKAKKPAPAPSANVLTSKRKRNDAYGGRQKQQKTLPTC